MRRRHLSQCPGPLSLCPKYRHTKFSKNYKKHLTLEVVCAIIILPLWVLFFCKEFGSKRRKQHTVCVFPETSICGGRFLYAASSEGGKIVQRATNRLTKFIRKTGGAVMRVKITLACTECKQRNYNTMKNKKNTPDRLEVNKYCKFCRKHTLHKETK